VIDILFIFYCVKEKKKGRQGGTSGSSPLGKEREPKEGIEGKLGFRQEPYEWETQWKAQQKSEISSLFPWIDYLILSKQA
jgi:hypothetical protein